MNYGFILATTITPASASDSTYLPYSAAYSRHTNQSIEKVFADKGYAGRPEKKETLKAIDSDAVQDRPKQSTQ